MTLGNVGAVNGGYYNSGDDYFGLSNPNMAASTGTTNIFGTTGSYGGYYGVPQNLVNDPKGQMEYQYDMNNTASSYNVKNNAAQMTITDQCTTMASLISEGKEDEIMTKFEELESTLKSEPQFQKCSDAEIKAYAKNMFAQTTGMSLEDAINKNCQGDFSTGLTSGFHWGNADSTSKEELLAEINGTKPPTGAAKAFGTILGAIGGAVCLGIPALIGEHG